MVVDARDDCGDRATAERLADVRARAAQLPSAGTGGAQVEVVRLDPVTGNAAAVKPAAAAAAGAADVAETALAYAEEVAPLFGLTGDAVDFVAGPPVSTSSGARAVQLQPRLQGIGIFDAQLTVSFSPDGALAETVGRGVATSDSGPASPQIDATEAVRATVKQLAAFAKASAGATDPFGQPATLPAIDPAQVDLQVTSVDDASPERPTELSDGPLLATPIRAHLTWFPLKPELQLAWEVTLALAADPRPFRSAVSAADGTVLYFQPA